VTVPDAPRQPNEWDLPLWWVVVAGVVVWLLAAGGLLFYLIGPRVAP
jgi:hypothetical protein